jgi:hypothetical protein
MQDVRAEPKGPGVLLPGFARRPVLAERCFRIRLQARGLPSAPGVLAILGGKDGEWFLLDVVHGEDIAAVFLRHERRPYWRRIWGTSAVPAVAVHETTGDSHERQQITEAIWRQFPGCPCG